MKEQKKTSMLKIYEQLIHYEEQKGEKRKKKKTEPQRPERHRHTH